MRKLLAFAVLLAACGSKAPPPPAPIEGTAEVEDEPAPEPEPAPPAVKPSATLFGRIIDAQATSGGVAIIIDVGTNAGVQVAWSGEIVDVAGSGFTVTACSQKACRATVPVTLQVVKSSSMDVALWP